MLLADAPGLGKTLTAQRVIALWCHYQDRVRSQPGYCVPVMRGPPGSAELNPEEPLISLGRRFLNTAPSAPVRFVTKVSTANSHFNDFETLMDQKASGVYTTPPRPTGDDGPRQTWWRRFEEANRSITDSAFCVTPVVVMTWPNLKEA